jgi:hypothetical protein
MDVDGIVQWSPWGLAVVALLGLSGCVPADRGWVREQLAPVQVQVAEVRDRVAVVEEQFGRLDPKVDRILTQMEQRWQQITASYQHPADTRSTFPLPSPSQIPGNLPAETSLDLTITGGATPLGGGTIPHGTLTVEMPVETRQRQEPRKLTEGQREQLLRTLREDPKVPLTVVAIPGDNESYAFARKLDMLFDIAEWPTRGVSQQTVSGVPPGLTFVTNSGDAAVFARAAGIQDTLHAVGIAAQSRALEGMPQGVLMLVVGPQPR